MEAHLVRDGLSSAQGELVAYGSGPDLACAVFACLSFQYYHFYVQLWVLSLQTMWEWASLGGTMSTGVRAGEDSFSLSS